MKGRRNRVSGQTLWVSLSFLCIPLLPGCDPASAVSTLTVDRARARPTAAGAENGAVYLEIVNGTSRADRLLAAEGSVAAAIETHETVHEDGMARMLSRPQGFEIPARSTVKLEPGGKHIMLVGLRGPLEAGKSFPLKLRFQKSGIRVVEVPVVDVDGACCRGHPSGAVAD